MSEDFQTAVYLDVLYSLVGNAYTKVSNISEIKSCLDNNLKSGGAGGWQRGSGFVALDLAAEFVGEGDGAAAAANIRALHIVGARGVVDKLDHRIAVGLHPYAHNRLALGVLLRQIFQACAGDIGIDLPGVRGLEREVKNVLQIGAEGVDIRPVDQSEALQSLDVVVDTHRIAGVVYTDEQVAAAARIEESAHALDYRPALSLRVGYRGGIAATVFRRIDDCALELEANALGAIVSAVVKCLVLKNLD